MCASHAQTFVCACERAEHLCTLLYGEPAFVEEHKLFVLFGNGRCVDNKARLGVAACVGYLVHVLFIVDEHALFLQLVSEF